MTEFHLPGSSYEELSKIIQAYGHIKEKAGVDQVGNLAGIHKTTVSRSSKFLTDAGLISSGAQKAPTELGRKLARALEHKVADDIQRHWREAVSQNEKFSQLVTTLRIKSGMDEKTFSEHILYVSGQQKSKQAETGARTVVDILVASGMILEENGALSVSKVSVINSDQDSKVDGPVAALKDFEATGPKVEAEMPTHTSADAVVSVSPTPQVTINIQLQIPEASDPDTYDRLFKALAENLFPPKNA